MKSSITGSFGWISRALVTTFAAALLLAPLASQASGTTMQQEPTGRFRVLVVPLPPTTGLNSRFGEQVAQALSRRLEESSTHAPVSKDELNRALKTYRIKKEDLDPIRARQLANQMGWNVLFVGTVEPAASGFQVTAAFVDPRTGDEVAVPPLHIPDGSAASVQLVADAATQAFDAQVRFLRARQFCQDYVASQQPQSALTNCNEALGINPASVPALFNKAQAFRQLYEKEPESGGTNGWADSAIAYFERVLEYDPANRAAMQNAAYLCSLVGDGAKASELYRRYLELDPANVPVRLKVAYDMVQAGLMKEAIDIVQAGLQFTANDLNLLKSLGSYSLVYSTTDSSYVDVAVQSYASVLQIQGDSAEVGDKENAVLAYTLAGRTGEAIAVAERALEMHTDSPRLWSLYADALAREERHGEAVQAMDQVILLDAVYPRAHLKRAMWKIERGEEAAALADLDQAIESGNVPRDDVFGLFWSQGLSLRGEGRLTEAAQYFERALRYAPADRRQDVEFWWGYALFQLGEQLAKPDEASLSELQRAQQSFQAAKGHFARAGSVRREVPQLAEATDQWLENVGARIRRLSRGG